MNKSLHEFAYELLPLVERNPNDPEFIFRLREWDLKYACAESLGLPFGSRVDISELFGIHRFLFDTEPGNFPITQDAIELTRHQTGRHLRGELSWNASKITNYRLPQLLIHFHLFCCDSCQGYLNYCTSDNHGIVLECDSCGGVFPTDAPNFDYADRFEESVGVDRPATKRELLAAGLFPVDG